MEGLRTQRFYLNNASNPNAYLAGDSVYFPIEVEYEPMSEFASKAYYDQFAAAFPFAEMQPYWRAYSTFQHLAVPTATKTSALKR